jgi:hypothetical protein
MTIALLALAGVVIALLLWDRLSQPPAGRPAPRTPTRPPQRRTLDGGGTPRFQGRGIVPARTAERRAAPQARGGRIGHRAAPAAGQRFSGGVRRSPNAVGLACGRPIAECTRGADCLCVD